TPWRGFFVKIAGPDAPKRFWPPPRMEADSHEKFVLHKSSAFSCYRTVFLGQAPSAEGMTRAIRAGVCGHDPIGDKAGVMSGSGSCGRISRCSEKVVGSFTQRLDPRERRSPR